MNSFFFWLTTASAIGAIISKIVHPGIAEIIFVAALANLAFYGFRRFSRRLAAAMA